jgi:replicative DNA helicase
MINTKHLEEVIVGILMRDEEDIDYHLSKLKEEYFKYELPRNIYNSIKRLKKRKRPIDNHLIISDMRADVEEHEIPSGDVIAVFQCAPSSKNMVHYIQELIDSRQKEGS